MGSGLGSTEASFSVPSFLWDSFREEFRDAVVSVSVDGTVTDFVGYVAADTGTVSPDETSYEFTAYTFTHWMPKVHIGQEENVWEMSYPITNPATGLATGWTAVNILRDLIQRLPSFYRTKLELGDLSAIQDSNGIKTPAITFRLVSIAEGITQMMGYFGDVACRERFQGGKTYLDFYRILDPGTTTVRLIVSQNDDPAISGANVQKIDRNENAADVVTRVIGFGAYRQFMVSCKSAVTELPDQSQSNPLKALVPDWNTALEPMVLANPKLASSDKLGYTAVVKSAVTGGLGSFAVVVGVDIPPGAILKAGNGELMLVTGFTPAVASPPADASVTVTRGYQDTTVADLAADDALQIYVNGIQYVFRRYRLPAAFAGVHLLNNNCLKNTTNQNYKVQLWNYPAIESRTITPTGTEDQTFGTISTQPQLLTGGHIELDKMTFTLAKPAVELKQRGKDSTGKIKATYQQTVVGITFTYQDKSVPFGHDTGQPTSQLLKFDFAGDGLTDRWQKNELEHNLAGNAGYPLAGLEFGCVYFDESTGLPNGIPEGSAVVIRDDGPTLKALCEQILREKNRRARSYSATIPYFDRGFKIGYRCIMEGERNYIADVYKITGVTHSMPITGEHETTVTIDNVKPPQRMKATKPVSAGMQSSPTSTATPDSGWMSPTNGLNNYRTDMKAFQNGAGRE